MSLWIIFSWIVHTIQLAYHVTGLSPPSEIQAHSTRAGDTSWAAYAKISLDMVYSAASWAMANTFVEHYRLDVAASSSGKFESAVCSAASVQ